MIYGARSWIFLLLVLLNFWWIFAVISYMIQSHDKQVWKISDVESGKEVNGGKLMEMMEKER